MLCPIPAHFWSIEMIGRHTRLGRIVYREVLSVLQTGAKHASFELRVRVGTKVTTCESIPADAFSLKTSLQTMD